MLIGYFYSIVIDCLYLKVDKNITFEKKVVAFILKSVEKRELVLFSKLHKLHGKIVRVKGCSLI